MPSTDVLIVGAGPTGLMLALQLARRGVAFRIVANTSGPGQASRAMAMHARTLEFYDQLGLADAIVAGGFKMQTIHLREHGHDVASVGFGDIGEGLSPYPFVLSFPQDDQERFLVGELARLGVEVEWDTELTGFTQTASEVVAILTHAGVKDECRPAYLCGCDGARSRVRHGLELDFAGGDYDQLFYVADVEVAGPPTHDLFVNLGADNLALMLPVRSSGMQRLIGTVSPALSKRTDLTFDDLRVEAQALLGVKVEAVNWFSTYHVHHRVAAHFRVGRAFLAGDAGHIHSPAGGQGMNTGIGDAVNLGWKLAEVLKGRADAAILDSYETERIAFARLLVSTTDTAFRAAVSRGRAGHFVRTWLLPAIAPMATSFTAVRQAMFNTVSQIKIAYHDSALSEGRAGHVKGGDRLPWVAGDGGGNFACLRGMDWRVHVYGVVDAAFAAAMAGLGLPVDGFAWNEAAGHAGLKRDAAYLVRPDGYVALALGEQDAGKVEAYLTARGVRPH